MSKADEVLEAWARKEFAVPDSWSVSIADYSVTEGGCDTYGHGGDQGYYLDLTFRAPNSRGYGTDEYRTERWSGGFTTLLEVLLDG